jgi:hypothetical protein
VSSEMAVRRSPVSVCVAFTVTPGSEPPLSSRTLPLICAVETDWAAAGPANATRNRAVRSCRMGDLLCDGGR